MHIASTLNIDLISTIDCVCSKMLNHGLNQGLFLSLFKLIPCHIPWIVYYMCLPILISYLNFKGVLALPKTTRFAQTHKSISFIWLVWSTLYVYLCGKTGSCIYTNYIPICFIFSIVWAFWGEGKFKNGPLHKLNTNPISSLLKQNSDKKSGAAQNLLSFNQSQRSSTI